MHHNSLRSAFLSVFLSVFFAGLGVASAHAQPDFAPLPTTSETVPKELLLRVVAYDGSTNGDMVVDVKNKSDHAVNFHAEGLYFVPSGNPESAPQRLGAAGPFAEVVAGKKGAYRQSTVVAGGETKRLHLKVFCIDSHRGSPSSGTKFSVAKSRMPKDLREDIASEADAIVRKNGGDVAKSVPEIQSATWKHRDKKWIRLEGERPGEAAGKTPSRTPVREQQSLDIE